jgi:hypothetical protein
VRKRKPSKKADLSTEFMQAMMDQDAKHTVSILENCTDTELRALIKTFMAVATMLLGYAVRRGLDISKEAQIVIELPTSGEEN